MTNFDKALEEIMFDLIDEHFPKGECKERGQAMVLVGTALYQIRLVHVRECRNVTGIDLEGN